MKQPLLQALAGRFPAVSRQELYARILCGEVRVDGAVIRDPKEPVLFESDFSFQANTYVSRGGLKMERALLDHHLEPAGKVFLDAGASTGGFTDCLLSRGAACVHAVDVGYNQLAFALRRRADVVVHERCNIMQITALDPSPDYAVADLSFRSLRGAASYLLGLVRGNRLLALVKPQYEWLNPPSSFDGVVRQQTDLVHILSDLVMALKDEHVAILSLSESPIRGRSGNREFFFLMEASESPDIAGVISRIREMMCGQADLR